MTLENEATATPVSIVRRLDPEETSSLVAVGFNPVTGDLALYEAFGATIDIFSADGALLRSIPRPGDSSNSFDLDYATEQLTLNGVSVPAGALLVTNSRFGIDQIYALDPVDGTVLSSLATRFSANALVGGAHHPIRNSFFVINQIDETLTEIDPSNGSRLGGFDLSDFGYEVDFGDVAVDPSTGELLIVSSTRNVILRVTPDGDLRGVAALPAGVSSLSGVAAIDADEIYVSSTLGEVFRLGFFPARNTPPTATALTVSFGEKETGRIIALLDGASDANGDPLSVRNVRFPFVHNVDEATGLLTIGDGQFDFVGGGESRNFPIFYDVFDGRDATSTSATVTILGVNDAPVARNETHVVAFNTPLNVLASGVLLNDTDPDEDLLAAALVTGPANGTLTFNPNGSFRYTPNAGFSGTDSFTYRATDGTARSDPATVTLNVAANSAPIAETDTANTGEDVPVTIDVLANDTDANGDALTILSVFNPVNGAVSLDDKGDDDPSNDEVIFTPKSGFSGAASFDYTVGDGFGGEATAAVSVSVAKAQEFSINVEATTVSEGDVDETVVRFAITRDSGAGAALVSLARIGDSDSADATDPPAVVAFDDGETLRFVDVSVFGDTEFEANETFGIEIVGVDQPAKLRTPRAEIVILNDDAPPPPPTQQVIVWAAGTAFEGDPIFDLYVNGALTRSGVAAPSAAGPLPASERDAAMRPFVFEVDAATDVESVAVVFTNDRWRGTPDTDRNLFVSKVEFGGETYTVEEHGDFTPQSGADQRKERTVESTGAMYWNGELEFSQRQIVTVHASGENYLGNPRFDLLINGELVATDVEVPSRPGILPFDEREAEADAFRFKVDADMEIENVGVRFTNDRYGGERDLDRNLFIPKIEVDGRELRPDPHAEFHKASGESPTEQLAAEKFGHLSVNGTLVFEVDDPLIF